MSDVQFLPNSSSVQAIVVAICQETGVTEVYYRPIVGWAFDAISMKNMEKSGHISGYPVFAEDLAADEYWGYSYEDGKVSVPGDCTYPSEHDFIAAIENQRVAAA